MIIGYTGYKRSGKSEAAKHTASAHGFVRVNFKDALIEELKDNYGSVLQELADTVYLTTVDRLFEDKPLIVRLLMQSHGQMRRNEDPLYWVEKWQKKIAPLLEEKKHIVVDDVRYLNEADAIRMHEGVVVRIVRDGQVNTDTHTSETEMVGIDPDFTITAPEGSPDVIRRGVDSIVSDLSKD